MKKLLLEYILYLKRRKNIVCYCKYPVLLYGTEAVPIIKNNEIRMLLLKYGTDTNTKEFRNCHRLLKWVTRSYLGRGTTTRILDEMKNKKNQLIRSHNRSRTIFLFSLSSLARINWKGNVSCKEKRKNGAWASKHGPGFRIYDL